MSINLRKQTSFITKIFQRDIIDLKENENPPQTRIQPVAWPSEALAQLGSIPVGECKRCMFYKIIGSAPTEPMSVTGRYICDAGNLYEAFHVERFKKYGMYKDQQLKVEFKIPESKNSVYVAGRIDVIIESDGVRKALELKSIGAYKAPKIMGDGKQLPLPSPSNLMQALLYKYYLTYTEEGKSQNIEEVYLMYINRSDGSIFYYKVDIDELGYPILTAINQCGKEIYELKLQDVPSFDSLLNMPGLFTGDEARMAELRINVKDVFNKFDLVYDYTTNKMLPSQDYSIVYNGEEIEREYKLGRISKIKYNKTQKGEPLGDGKCNYCMYRTKCMNDSGLTIR